MWERKKKKCRRDGDRRRKLLLFSFPFFVLFCFGPPAAYGVAGSGIRSDPQLPPRLLAMLDS